MIKRLAGLALGVWLVAAPAEAQLIGNSGNYLPLSGGILTGSLTVTGFTASSANINGNTTITGNLNVTSGNLQVNTGSIKLNGSSFNAFDAADAFPIISSTTTSGVVLGLATFPYQDNGSLVFQSRNQGAGRDLVFVTGFSPPVVREVIDRTGHATYGLGGILATNALEIGDDATLGNQILTNPTNFVAGSWAATGDFVALGATATYTHSTGVGTLTQTSGQFAQAYRVNHYYELTYTISGVATAAGNAACSAVGTAATCVPLANITTASGQTQLGSTALQLNTSANGTYSIKYKSAASLGNFVINVTSAIAGEAFTIGNLSLKEITGGTIDAMGSLCIGCISPARAEEIQIYDGATTTTTFANRYTHTSTATAAAGFGVGTEFYNQNGSGTSVNTGTIENIFTTVTNGAENADTVFYTIKAGAKTEQGRFTSAGIIKVSGGISLTNLADSITAPTISAGFCTSPSIVANNGTAAFTLNVGTGCAAGTGTVGLPAATTGWVCDFHDVTTPASDYVEQTGGSTTTVTVQNYARTTGLAANFVSSDVYRVMCRAY